MHSLGDTGTFVFFLSPVQTLLIEWAPPPPQQQEQRQQQEELEELQRLEEQRQLEEQEQQQHPPPPPPAPPAAAAATTPFPTFKKRLRRRHVPMASLEMFPRTGDDQRLAASTASASSEKRVPKIFSLEQWALRKAFEQFCHQLLWPPTGFCLRKPVQLKAYSLGF